MYLKRLEIQGFKSFATKTVLDFLPPKDGLFSITGIVGPNGAGKSNITDAIRWVMGETSMKNVRAKKSEDVIFNGPEHKGALGVAEVSMTLENAGDEAGLELPEIVLTRRLYRTGESEYLVNNNPVRLIDIHLLLAKAKFAEGAYSIVSQGMIDRLLTVTPAERKDFFDEACGIKEHQIKQHQASLKLARTEENSRQADVILREVEPRLKMLARQVKKLERRQEVETELQGAQEQYYFTIYDRNKTEVEGLKVQLKTIEQSYRAAFGELETIQTELAELARGATRQEVFEKLQADYQVVARAKNDLEREVAILEGQMHTEYSQAGRHNVGWLEGKVAELKGATERLAGEMTVAVATADKQKQVAKAERQRLENLTIEQTQIKLKIARLQNELLKDQSEQSYREISGLTAVKAVLEARQKFGKVYGLVAELGEVAEEFCVALEVAAGSHLSSIVVADETVARLAINYLRENRFGVATFLPLNKIMGWNNNSDRLSLAHEKGVLGVALSLIKYDAKFEPIFSMILGGTLIIEDLKVAERIGMGRARMVTLEGDTVERKGIMRGGFRNRKNSLSFSSKLFLPSDERQAEIQAAIRLETQHLEDIEKQIVKAQVQLMEAMVAAATLAGRATLVEESHHKDQAEFSCLEQELSYIKSSPEEYGEQLTKLFKDKTRLQKSLATNSNALAKASEAVEQFNRREEEKKQRVFALQTAMQERQQAVNGILQQRNELNIQMAKFETKQEDLAEEVMNDMRVSLHSIVERGAFAVAPERLAYVADTIQKLKYQLSLIGGIDAEVVKEYETTKERYDFLTGQLTDLKAATQDLNAMIGELDAIMKKCRAEAFKKIRKDFDRYFKILFGGGSAALEEIYGPPPSSEDFGEASESLEVAEEAASASSLSLRATAPKEKFLTGIEVIANPPGKKVKYLNMLSGGERTLTAIALISAILFHNPSPFVVLDEVEAALDEANTLRFVKILGELSTHCQFIVVTHNRVTMHAVGALYGVVMQGDGISKLLSVTVASAAEFEEAKTK